MNPRAFPIVVTLVTPGAEGAQSDIVIACQGSPEKP